MVQPKNQHKNLSQILLIFTFVALTSVASRGSVLQEGWYKILSGGQHVGFIVLRIEFDEKKKQFISTSYTQTSAMAGNLKESLVAVANDKLSPVSYQYTTQVGQIAKVIDAAFSKDMMTAKVTEGQKTEGVQYKLQKGTFLSQLMVYVILQSKQGFKVGNNFAYSAIAEEDAKAYTGEAFIAGTEKYMGLDAFKVLVTFKGTKYVNYVTNKGVILMTKSPTESLTTEMVGAAEEATKGLEVNRKTLSFLFKTLPGGGLPSGAAVGAAPAEEPAPANRVDQDKMKKLGGPKTDVPAGINVPPGKGVKPDAAQTPAAESTGGQ